MHADMRQFAITKLRILIVEDNQSLVANIFDYFEPSGHTMDTAPDGISGLHLAMTNEYDVIVLDIMLPGIDGMEVCRRLRQEAGLTTPVVMLTAKDALLDKLSGFECGTDDYLVKPIALPELETRLLALVRRARGSNEIQHHLQVGDLIYNLNTYEVSRAGRSIQLNPACRHILEVLMRESPHVVSRKRLEMELWGDEPPDNDVLRTHIYTLRLAIDRPFEKKLIKTLQRAGYRLSDDH